MYTETSIFKIVILLARCCIRVSHLVWLLSSPLSPPLSLSSGQGGGWGYSHGSVEAFRFSPDQDILLGGFGLFGGRGNYSAEIKVRNDVHVCIFLCHVLVVHLSNLILT